MIPRLIAILILLAWSAAAFGQTITEVYVDTDVVGGDADGSSWANAYSSADAALEACKADLVTETRILRINLRGATNADSTALGVSSGYTTNATYYIWFKVDADDRHAGVWSDAKYRLVKSLAYDEIIDTLPAYTVLEGLQVRNTSGTSSRCARTQNIAYYRQCIFRGGASYGVQLAGGSRMTNCIVTEGDTYGIQGTSYAAGITLVNCTSVNGNGYGIYQSVGTTMTAINCYAEGGTASWGKAGTLSLTNCYSPDEVESTTLAAFTTDTFTNVTDGTEDLHLVSGSALIGAGSSTASTYTAVDIDGDARPQNTTWDVGADEYIAPEATPLYAVIAYPANEATGTNRTVKLRWTDDASAVAHDVWGGTNPTSLTQLVDGGTNEW